MMKKQVFTYFKIDPKYKNYKGDRYFRFGQYDEHATQVCVNTGEEKRGRNATYGIYLISRVTLLSNYIMFGYAVPCTKSEYEKAFDKVIEGLRCH